MHITATEIKEQQQVQTENSARLFAAVTHEARDIAQVITQSFDVRIKNNPDAVYGLYCGYHSSLEGEHFATVMGKTLTAKVNWRALDIGADCFMHLELSNGASLLVDDKWIKSVITQKGMAPKMYEAWKLAAGKQ